MKLKVTLVIVPLICALSVSQTWACLDSCQCPGVPIPHCCRTAPNGPLVTRRNGRGPGQCFPNYFGFPIGSDCDPSCLHCTCMETWGRACMRGTCSTDDPYL